MRGHQGPDTPAPPATAEARYQDLVRHLPSRPLRYRGKYMTRRRAYDVAIAFGQATDLPCRPKLGADGSWSAEIPMEYLEGLFEGLGGLPTREASPR